MIVRRLRAFLPKAKSNHPDSHQSHMKDELIDIFANIEQDIERAADEGQKLVRSDDEVV